MQQMTLDALGFSEADVHALAMAVARAAAYQMEADRRGVPWRELATVPPVDLIGPERWASIATFALGAVSDLAVNGEIDAEGPVIREHELVRLGALVAMQYVAQEDAD